MINDNRKKLLINPAFQKTFLKYTIGSALAVSAFYYLALWVFFANLESKGLSMGLAPDHIFFLFVRQQVASLGVFFLAASLLMVLGLLVYGLYVSNRIAGPIHQVVTQMKNNRLENKSELIQFRKKDFFHELADEANLTISGRSARNGLQR